MVDPRTPPQEGDGIDYVEREKWRGSCYVPDETRSPDFRAVPADNEDHADTPVARWVKALVWLAVIALVALFIRLTRP